MARMLGWLITLLYAAQGVLTIRMPRTEKTALLREELRSWHYLLGLLLFIALLWRLWVWYRDRPEPGSPRLSPASNSWTRQLALATYLVLCVMPVLGITSAWTDGLTVRLGPFLTLPALLGESRALWMFSGYFHSAFGFAATLLSLAAILTGIWLLLRRGVGMLEAFPPGFGAQAWLTLLVTVYAASTFKSPEPGMRAIAIYLFLTLAVWALGRWLARRRSAVHVRVGLAGAGARAAGAVATVALIGLASFLPYRTFRVTPWPVGEVLEAPEGVTSHAGPVTQVTITPETAFEKQVRAETFKWCRFCHTMEQGGKHLVGPNLYAIFGQQAGTAPNYHYSSAMAAAGRNGLVWNDETLDKFLANPDAFIPGTSMIISSGPVKTPEERAAVINILKRETMPATALR